MTDTSELDRESAKLQNECKVVGELLRKCVEQNASTAIDQAKYQERYTGLVERYETIKKGLAKIEDKLLEQSAKRESITAFMQTLARQEGLLVEFDEGLWNAIVDRVIVHSENEINFVFKDGMEVNI